MCTNSNGIGPTAHDKGTRNGFNQNGIIQDNLEMPISFHSLSLSHPLFATPKWQYFSSVQFCCPHSVWLWNWKHSVGAAFFPFLFSNWKEGWIFHSIVQFQILCNFRCCSMLLRSIQFTHSHFKLEFEIFPPASLSFIIDLLAFAGLKLIKFFFSLAFRFVFTFCNWNIRIELGDLVEWAWN